MPINVETPKEQKDENATLDKIYKELQNISKDQKHIGEFLGENIHSIRKILVFFTVLTIINIFLSLFF